MTIGVGGSTPEKELERLQDMTADVQPVQLHEFEARIAKAQQIMQANGIRATYLNAGTNLYYFTGTRWYASERLVGAILPAEGKPEYICPAFEEGTLLGFMQVKGSINGWHEHESPYELLGQVLRRMGLSDGVIAIDEASAFFISNGIAKANPDFDYTDAKVVTAGCRSCKSETEIALLQRAKDMTMEVHKAAARILRPGITTQEVTDFINEAHKRVGAAAGSYFCIVLFGVDSSFPHGVKTPQPLVENDIVLIDTGCQLQGYNSDITRTYVYGTPSERHREVWEHEKAAQAAGFAAARNGEACGDVDVAARSYLESKGYGPGYAVPGLPHRTGHGIGLDIHEWPYLVRSDKTPLAKGMCFSNEPMLVIPGEFGVRLEDHFYMAEDGPKWFTQPSHSIDDPFGYEA